MEHQKERPHRRASFGYAVRLQTLVTPEMASGVRKLAELLECSEGAVVRDALEAYDLHKRIVTAQETARKRRQRAEKAEVQNE